MSRTTCEPGVLVGLYDLILWYTKHTERFPKSLRVTLGDRIDNKMLDILEMAIRARYSKDARKLLLTMNTELDILRYMTRLAKDRGALSMSQYEYAVREMESVGRQVGGWLRSEGRNANV